jgi:hypothetical protein
MTAQQTDCETCEFRYSDMERNKQGIKKCASCKKGSNYKKDNCLDDNHKVIFPYRNEWSNIFQRGLGGVQL